MITLLSALVIPREIEYKDGTIAFFSKDFEIIDLIYSTTMIHVTRKCTPHISSIEYVCHFAMVAGSFRLRRFLPHVTRPDKD